MSKFLPYAWLDGTMRAAAWATAVEAEQRFVGIERGGSKLVVESG